jgi:hypothetical protein
MDIVAAGALVAGAGLGDITPPQAMTSQANTRLNHNPVFSWSDLLVARLASADQQRVRPDRSAAERSKGEHTEPL